MIEAKEVFLKIPQFSITLSMQLIHKVIRKITDARNRITTEEPLTYRLKVGVEPDDQMATFWVSERMLTGREDVLSFRSPRSQEPKQTSLVKELFTIKGVDFVELVAYEIRVAKAEVYTWKELLKPIEAVIRKHLARRC